MLRWIHDHHVLIEHVSSRTRDAEGTKVRSVARWPLMRCRRFRSASLWLRTAGPAFRDDDAGRRAEHSPSVAMKTLLAAYVQRSSSDCCRGRRGRGFKRKGGGGKAEEGEERRLLPTVLAAVQRLAPVLGPGADTRLAGCRLRFLADRGYGATTAVLAPGA